MAIKIKLSFGLYADEADERRTRGVHSQIYSAELQAAFRARAGEGDPIVQYFLSGYNTIQRKQRYYALPEDTMLDKAIKLKFYPAYIRKAGLIKELLQDGYSTSGGHSKEYPNDPLAPVAVNLYMEAFEHGYDEGAYFAASFYDKGWGMAKDSAKAWALLTKGLMRNEFQASLRVCELYFTPGPYFNRQKGKVLLSRLVMSDDDRAWLLRARTNLQLNRPDSTASAMRILTRIASKGNGDAALLLGLIYKNGTNKQAVDTNKAVEYFVKAAAADHPAAAGILAGLYEEGIPETNNVKYRFWANKANRDIIEHNIDTALVEGSIRDLSSLAVNIVRQNSGDAIWDYLSFLSRRRYMNPQPAIQGVAYMYSTQYRHVYAATISGYLDTGIPVKKGEKMALKASGWISLETGIGVTPAGYRRPELPFNTNAIIKDKNYPYGIFMARFGEGRWQDIGNSHSESVLGWTTNYDGDGNLILGINDSYERDNIGYFDVIIEVFRLD